MSKNLEEKWADEYSRFQYGPVDPDEVTLHKGLHDDPSEGHCLLEVVSMFAGEPFSDSPDCVCPVLAEFGRSWNDGLTDNAAREQLRQYIPRLVGTKSTEEVESRRSMMSADWLIRVYTPTWLDRNPDLATHAAALRAHPEIIDADGLISVQPVVVAASTDAFAASAAAGRAASDAAMVAEGVAAGGAARAATWASSRSTIWASSRSTIWTVTWVATWAAISSAKGSATEAAARAALAPTVTELQTSAHALFGRMIRVTEQSPC